MYVYKYHFLFVGNPVINFDLKSRTEPINSATRILLSYVLMGYPLPTSDSVTWSHNGEKLTFPNSLGVISIDSGLLIPPTFTNHHAGNYSATVTSATGIGSDSFYFNLKCKFTVLLKWGSTIVQCASTICDSKCLFFV